MKDFLNKLKIRNSENTEPWDYNCGGYALKTYSWYIPGIVNKLEEVEKDEIDYIIEDYWDEIESEFIFSLLDKKIEFESQDYFIELNNFTEYLADNILKDFGKSIRKISNIDEAKDEERIVIFRVGALTIHNYDFHFVFKEVNDDYWKEKRGGLNIGIVPRITEEILSNSWNWYSSGYVYNSKNIIFALKKQD